MKKRNPVAVVALTLVTLTVYAYYWLYSTTDELKRATGRRDLNPLLDVVLTLLTFGFWGMWAAYRNARITHETLVDLGEPHTDRSLMVAGFSALSLVSGWAWLVGMLLLQEDLNELADHEHDYYASSPAHAEREARTSAPRRATARVRVEVEPSERPAHGSAWDHAPSAPVFESTAPAPVVY